MKISGIPVSNLDSYTDKKKEDYTKKIYELMSLLDKDSETESIIDKGVEELEELQKTRIQLCKIEIQYETQVLIEVMNLKLVALKEETRALFSRRFSDWLNDIVGFLNTQRSNWEKGLDNEYDKILFIKNEILRNKAIESFEETVDTVFSEYERSLFKLRDLLMETLAKN